MRIGLMNLLWPVRLFNTQKRLAALLRLSYLAIVLSLVTQTTQAAIPYSERTVLLNIYASTLSWTWIKNTGWGGPPGTECSWYGITCDAAGANVIGIDLTGNALQGSLPALTPLTHLQILKVGSTPFCGFACPQPVNFLKGLLPPLSGLTQLQYVALGGQEFTGPFPTLAGLSHLEYFDANGNGFSGSIPAFDGLTHLNHLDLSYNALLTGPIPTLNELKNLTYFRLSQSRLTGPLPSLQGLTHLQKFDVSDNFLTGTVPDFSGLPQLQYFDVSVNQLNGNLPAQLTDLPALQHFGAGENRLNGKFTFGPALNQLQNFDISVNDFTAVVGISQMSSLTSLNVSFNPLSGTVPTPPPLLAAGKSALCPSQWIPAAIPLSAADAAWNLATGMTPWSLYCTQKPLPALLIISSNPTLIVLPGQPVAFTAHVYGGVPATGTLTFYAKYSDLYHEPITQCTNVPLVNATATCTTLLPTQYDQYDVTASYSGDANNAPLADYESSGNYGMGSLINILHLPSETSSADLAQAGQPVDLVATFDSNAGRTVSFYDGTAVLCNKVSVIYTQNESVSFPLPGQLLPTAQYIALCPITFAVAGKHSLSVRYDSDEPTMASPALTQTITAQTLFDADQSALSGAWYRPVTAGEGLMIQVSPDQAGAGKSSMFGGWFTFDALGNAQWVTFSGNLDTAHGAIYQLKLAANTGGNFNTQPITTAHVVGTATLTFQDCTHATLTYVFDDGRKATIPETRLTAPTACSASVPAMPQSASSNYNDALHAGAWYDPDTSGQGLFIDIVPSQKAFFAAWFTYAPQNENLDGSIGQRWFTIQASYTPGDLKIKNAPIFLTMGGLFNTPSSLLNLQIGTADITFTSCTTMTLQYNFMVPRPNIQSEFTGLSGTINEQAIAPMPSCR